MHKETSAGVVVFRENGERKYLLLLYGEGHWDYVKGHIEEGETETQTAMREAAEEAGLADLQFVDGFRKQIQYFFRRGQGLVSKEVVFLLARSCTERITLSFEHKGFVWLPYEDAHRKLTFRNARDVLQQSEEFLKNRAVQRTPTPYGESSTF